MALQNTSLLLQLAPLPATWKGTPAQFAELLVSRLKIVSLSGVNFIYIGDAEPLSNQGPWLKHGRQWWVWSEEIKRYVPLDISESETHWFHIGNTVPTTAPPYVWLRTTASGANNTSPGTPLGWYVYDGTAWAPFVGVVPAGPSSQRPTNPTALQMYYDTDILCLIWWEREADRRWRTRRRQDSSFRDCGRGTSTKPWMGHSWCQHYRMARTLYRSSY